MASRHCRSRRSHTRHARRFAAKRRVAADDGRHGADATPSRPRPCRTSTTIARSRGGVPSAVPQHRRRPFGTPKEPVTTVLLGRPRTGRRSARGSRGCSTSIHDGLRPDGVAPRVFRVQHHPVAVSRKFARICVKQSRLQPWPDLSGAAFPASRADPRKLVKSRRFHGFHRLSDDDPADRPP